MNPAFSSRVPAARRVNRLSQLRARCVARGVDVTDLTESNPTRVGLRYPPGLLDGLAAPAGLRYRPSPRGLPEARRAVAAWLSRPLDDARSSAAARPAGDAGPGGGSPFRPVAADRVVLTAGTSEAYSCLFKLLCDPGDRVLVPRPSYPLLELLARFEGVEPAAYPLAWHGAWTIDLPALRAAADARARAVVVVNPNNPTGSFLTPGDHEALTALCRERGLRLIVDEVFNDYPLDPLPGHARGVLGARSAGSSAPSDGLDPLPGHARSVLERPADVLTFVLGGLSKAVGLPQVKLGWIAVDGPAREVESALGTLDLLLDAYLSVSTPVQLAAERLLAEGASVARQIRARVKGNHRTLARLAAEHPAAGLLRAEGGWYGVIRAPATTPEETLALELLERDHVLVHPGYFFDFPREAFFVTSLLPEPGRFEPAVRRLLARACGE